MKAQQKKQYQENQHSQIRFEFNQKPKPLNSLNQQLYIAHQALIKAHRIAKHSDYTQPIKTLKDLQLIEFMLNNALDDLESLANQADIFETHNTADTMPIGV